LYLTIKHYSEQLGSDYEQNVSKVNKKTNPLTDWFKLKNLLGPWQDLNKDS
jgi:hypothetical protein